MRSHSSRATRHARASSQSSLSMVSMSRTPGSPKPRDSPADGAGRSLWVSVWRTPSHDVHDVGARRACGRGPPPQTGHPGNDYSSAVQRCLSAEQSVHGMNRASPGWGIRRQPPVPASGEVSAPISEKSAPQLRVTPQGKVGSLLLIPISKVRHILGMVGRCAMSYVIAAPEMMASAATDLAGIGSTLSAGAYGGGGLDRRAGARGSR